MLGISLISSCEYSSLFFSLGSVSCLWILQGFFWIFWKSFWDACGCGWCTTYSILLILLRHKKYLCRKILWGSWDFNKIVSNSLKMVAGFSQEKRKKENSRQFSEFLKWRQRDFPGFIFNIKLMEVCCFHYWRRSLANSSLASSYLLEPMWRLTR